MFKRDNIFGKMTKFSISLPKLCLLGTRFTHSSESVTSCTYFSHNHQPPCHFLTITPSKLYSLAEKHKPSHSIECSLILRQLRFVRHRYFHFCALRNADNHCYLACRGSYCRHCWQVRWKKSTFAYYLGKVDNETFQKLLWPLLLIELIEWTESSCRKRCIVLQEGIPSRIFWKATMEQSLPMDKQDQENHSLCK